MTNTVWRCEQIRGSEIANRIVFDSEEKATSFVSRMRLAEPDLNTTWRVVPVEAEVDRN
jgi:hypothetical protein